MRRLYGANDERIQMAKIIYLQMYEHNGMILVISLLRRLMIIFKHLKKVLGPMFDTELLQHSKLNCTE